LQISFGSKEFSKLLSLIKVQKLTENSLR